MNLQLSSLDSTRGQLYTDRQVAEQEWAAERRLLRDDIREARALIVCSLSVLHDLQYRMRSEVAESKLERLEEELGRAGRQLEEERSAHAATMQALGEVRAEAQSNSKQLSAARQSTIRMQELRDRFQGDLTEALAHMENLEKASTSYCCCSTTAANEVVLWWLTLRMCWSGAARGQ